MDKVQKNNFTQPIVVLLLKFYAVKFQSSADKERGSGLIDDSNFSLGDSNAWMLMLNTP
jgi:hypothetical protein